MKLYSHALDSQNTQQKKLTTCSLLNLLILANKTIHKQEKQLQHIKIYNRLLKFNKNVLTFTYLNFLSINL